MALVTAVTPQCRLSRACPFFHRQIRCGGPGLCERGRGDGVWALRDRRADQGGERASVSRASGGEWRLPSALLRLSLQPGWDGRAWPCPLVSACTSYSVLCPEGWGPAASAHPPSPPHPQPWLKTRQVLNILDGTVYHLAFFRQAAVGEKIIIKSFPCCCGLGS